MKEQTIANNPAAMQRVKVLGDRRRGLGLTQEQLGDKLNMSRSIISQYEVGTRVPVISFYNRLADFFHWPHYNAPDETTPIDFSEDTPKSEAVSPVLSDLLNDVRTIAVLEDCSAEEILTALLSKALKPYKNALAVLRMLHNDIQKESKQ